MIGGGKLRTWSGLPALPRSMPSPNGAGRIEAAELSLVFSNDERVQELNADYRGKPKPTNVLSFPSNLPGELPAGQEKLLGDVIVAFETISREASEQGKTLENHLCHLIVHGVLHLLGYDHEIDSSADKMEALEIAALAHMSVPNPYKCDI